jgi:AAA+ ATPase superfamily predicted ATPase
MLIEYFAQNIIVIHVQGTSLEKITALYNGSTPDYKSLYWVTDKSEAKAEADKTYIREALLGIKEEELPEVLELFQKQITGYIYQDINNGDYFVLTTTPGEELRVLW